MTKFSGMWGGRTIDELVLVFRQEIPLDCDKIWLKADKMEWEIRLELLVENEIVKQVRVSVGKQSSKSWSHCQKEMKKKVVFGSVRLSRNKRQNKVTFWAKCARPKIHNLN